LQRDTRLPLLMVVYQGPSYYFILDNPRGTGYYTQMDFAQDLRLIDIRGTEYAPLEYDHTFDHPVLLEQYRKALIYFPSKSPDDLDLLNDSSFTLHLQNAHLGEPESPWTGASKETGEWWSDRKPELTWTFSLVPVTTALEDLDRRIETQIDIDIDASDILKIIEIIVTVLPLL
jgi:hypothetical protein